jgi:hypothetical protein
MALIFISNSLGGAGGIFSVAAGGFCKRKFEYVYFYEIGVDEEF